MGVLVDVGAACKGIVHLYGQKEIQEENMFISRNLKGSYTEETSDLFSIIVSCR